MSDIKYFVDNLLHNDVLLTVSNGQLKVDGPSSILTKEVCLTLRQRKAEIISLLDDKERSSANEPFPLSYTQLCFWFVFFTMKETANNLSRLLISLPVRPEMIEAAIHAVIKENAIFQLTFGEVIPTQKLQPVKLPKITVVDLSGKAEMEQNLLVANDVKDIMQPFDLTAMPLYRFKYYRLNSKETLLVSCFPHIVLDGAAMHLFETALKQKLLELISGGLAESQKHQFALQQYVARQRKRYTEEGDTQYAFWQERLQGVSRAAFPEDCVAILGNPHTDKSIPISEDFMQKVHDVSVAERVSMQMIFTAIVSQAISKITGAEQFVVNSVLENRVEEEEINLMAPILYLLPTPVHVGSCGEFKSILKQVKSHMTQTQTKMDLPFSVLQGMIAENRWRGLAKPLAASIKAVSRCLSWLMPSAKLYSSFWSDYVFAGNPPFTAKRNKSGKKMCLCDPVININLLPNTYKTLHTKDIFDGQKIVSLTDKFRFLPQQPLDGNWEDDQIDFYISDNGKGQLVFRVTCCCLNENGLSSLENELNACMDEFSNI